jgi:hypothetical protein
MRSIFRRFLPAARNVSSSAIADDGSDGWLTSAGCPAICSALSCTGSDFADRLCRLCFCGRLHRFCSRGRLHRFCSRGLLSRLRICGRLYGLRFPLLFRDCTGLFYRAVFTVGIFGFRILFSAHIRLILSHTARQSTVQFLIQNELL